MEERAPKESGKPEFDFDQWCELAKSDPEQFEAKRREVIDEFISSASPSMEKRLRQLQWRIDMERKRCKNPMMSCMKLFDMMWDFVHAERGFLHAVSMLSEIASGSVPEVADPRGGVVTSVLQYPGKSRVGGSGQASTELKNL